MEKGIGSTMPEERLSPASEWAFLGVSGLLFAASAGGLIYWTVSMSGGMPMSTDSNMVWMRLPGQTWLEAAGSFMGMWMVMMLAMMLPSLVPSLLSYRRSVRRLYRPRLGGLPALAGVGYFAAWAVFGVVAYPLGVLITTAEMQWMDLARLAPLLTGIVLVLAGILQLTGWKTRMLRDYREAPAREQSLFPLPRDAWQYGLRLGVHCILCCIGFMVVLLVTGVMNLGIMALTAAAITVERLAPKPVPVARLLGAILVVAGAVLFVSHLSGG